MEYHRRVLCPENEELASFMWRKRQEMAEPEGISERIDATIHKAYCNVCNFKTPIKTLKEFSEIKGVGKWILKLMKGFFDTDSCASQSEQLMQKGKKTKGMKRYVPQKNSVAYALLITLYRGNANGSGFMRKQELIDAAEASGLSRVPIAQELGKGKPGHFGSSPREWYSGWSCMKTLITKGLVAKSSCPAKYMLTDEGQAAARECLSRSGTVDPAHLNTKDGCLDQDIQNVSVMEFACTDSTNEELSLPSVDLRSQNRSADVPVEFLEGFTLMGYSKEQIHVAFKQVSQSCQDKEMSSLWSVVLRNLQKYEVCYLHSESSQSSREDCLVTSSHEDFTKKTIIRTDFACISAQKRQESSCSLDSAQSSLTLRACSSRDHSIQKLNNDGDHSIQKLNRDGVATNINTLKLPPLAAGEKFEDVYEVILILDNREQFTNQGPRSRKIIENIRTEFKIQIEVRRLPVGDGVWIARHKHLDNEYVLDFIVERKNVDDLRSSIRDNRYRDQKLRLLRCGLKKLIYVVEGDPNASEVSESIKTACFTTEILEGFDVQRTTGLGDTLRKYGYLTHAINHYYRMQVPDDKISDTGVCLSFDKFVKKCQDLEKMTVSDVFAVQLMQVPQVTEDVAVAVLDLYPTLLSLAHAYSLLDGDICAQEDMLRKQSNDLICGVASRNIFQLVWGR